MKKYSISWDAGYGIMYAEIEAESREEAERAAYESWRDDAESQASYGVEVEDPTDEDREELGV